MPKTPHSSWRRSSGSSPRSITTAAPPRTRAGRGRGAGAVDGHVEEGMDADPVPFHHPQSLERDLVSIHECAELHRGLRGVTDEEPGLALAAAYSRGLRGHT